MRHFARVSYDPSDDLVGKEVDPPDGRHRSRVTVHFSMHVDDAVDIDFPGGPPTGWLANVSL